MPVRRPFTCPHDPHLPAGAIAAIHGTPVAAEVTLAERMMPRGRRGLPRRAR